MGGEWGEALGMEIQRLEDGAYYIHHSCYAREIWDRNKVKTTIAFAKVPDEGENCVEAYIAQVRIKRRS